MRKLAVFCGARHGHRPAYTAAAQALGSALASLGCGLVYGAGRVGLMGVVAQACLDAGGHVTGVIPTFLNSAELLHPDLQSCHTTVDLFERKSMMMDIADGFVILPGGIGTFDELLEVMAWRQLRQLDKPIAVLDVDDYFKPWWALLDHVVAEGFADDAERRRLIVQSQPEALLETVLGIIDRQAGTAAG